MYPPSFMICFHECVARFMLIYHLQEVDLSLVFCPPFKEKRKCMELLIFYTNFPNPLNFSKRSLNNLEFNEPATNLLIPA